METVSKYNKANAEIINAITVMSPTPNVTAVSVLKKNSVFQTTFNTKKLLTFLFVKTVKVCVEPNLFALPAIKKTGLSVSLMKHRLFKICVTNNVEVVMD